MSIKSKFQNFWNLFKNISKKFLHGIKWILGFRSDSNSYKFPDDQETQYLSDILDDNKFDAKLESNLLKNKPLDSLKKTVYTTKEILGGNKTTTTEILFDSDDLSEKDFDSSSDTSSFKTASYESDTSFLSATSDYSSNTSFSDSPIEKSNDDTNLTKDDLEDSYSNTFSDDSSFEIDTESSKKENKSKNSIKGPFI